MMSGTMAVDRKQRSSFGYWMMDREEAAVMFRTVANHFVSGLALGGLLFGWERLMLGRLCGNHPPPPPTRNDDDDNDDDDDLILDHFVSVLAMGGLLFGWERLWHSRLCYYNHHTLFPIIIRNVDVDFIVDRFVTGLAVDGLLFGWKRLFLGCLLCGNRTPTPTSNDGDDDDLILVRHDGNMVMMRRGYPRPPPAGGDTIAPAIRIGLHVGFSVGMILANAQRRRRRHNRHDGSLMDDGMMMVHFALISGQLALGMLLVDQDRRRQTYCLRRKMVGLMAGFGNGVILGGVVARTWNNVEFWNILTDGMVELRNTAIAKTAELMCFLHLV
jgi:hypothetical protein